MCSLARVTLVIVFTGAFVFVGCRRADQERALPSNGSSQTEVTSNAGTAAPADEGGKQRLPADCLIDKDYRDWLFTPSIAPIQPGLTNARNSARRVHRLRDRIVRVEIVHEYTRRPLFELSDLEVAALREAPDWPPLQFRDHGLPPGKDWPVVLLIYLEGEELPYAGHPYSNELYFAEDENPWNFYVWTEAGKAREIHPIPFGEAVYSALEEKLGRPDPGGMRAAEAKNEEDIRCGRARPTAAERPRPFPSIPRAIVEPAG